jgi:hypothetical protein
MELRPHGVIDNAVALGFVGTDMTIREATRYGAITSEQVTRWRDNHPEIPRRIDAAGKAVMVDDRFIELRMARCGDVAICERLKDQRPRRPSRIDVYGVEAEEGQARPLSTRRERAVRHFHLVVLKNPATWFGSVGVTLLGELRGSTKAHWQTPMACLRVACDAGSSRTPAEATCAQ